MNNILTSLNTLQLEAVTSTEGFVRVIAGAGSGKTKALTHRYAYLVKAAGIHPGNVLCVTFTNKASGEMKKRVRELIGDGCDTSLITTYHGFCVRVLRDDIGRLFYPQNFRILDIGDQKKILEEIYGELELKLDHASFEKILLLIDKKKSSPDYVDTMIKRGKDNYFKNIDNIDEKIIYRYLLRQKKMFALDFNDLINFVFVLFAGFDEVKKKWQKKLQYIQVDEFQDSSERELRLIDTLSEINKNLFVVGDPDQNIYEWRGAKVGILVDFDKCHENTKTVIMAQNYRSTAKILTAANTLIDKNQNRIKKNLFTNGDIGDDIVHLHAKNEREESRMIIEKIRSLHSSGFKYSNIAVMYRASFLSQFIESAFMTENIPYEIVGSTRFFERMEILDIIAYMKLVAYDDDTALMRIINTPRRSFGKKKLEKLCSLANETGYTLYKTLVEFRNNDEFRKTGVDVLIDLIEELRKIYTITHVTDIIQRLLTESGYESYIREAGNMERFDNLSEFKKIAQEHEHSYGKISQDDIMPPDFMPLEVFLGEIALMKNDDTQENSLDRVKLMTIHSAKGLEFPVCFVVGMTEGIFPSSRTIEERKQAGLEEERRLCFVSLTRAMKRLYLTDSEGTFSNSQTGYKKTPSRFLYEIGEENYTRIGSISKDLADSMRSFASEMDNLPESLDIGSHVDHVIFGSGEIIGIDLEHGVYIIRFDKNGVEKPISLDYDFGLWQRLMREQDEENISESINSNTQDTDCEDKSSEDTSYEDKSYEDKSYEDKSINNSCNDLTEAKNISGASPETNITEEAPEIPQQTENETKNNDISYEICVPDNTNNAIPIKIPEHTDNLWKRDDVPHEGWYCTDIIDLGAPNGICGMCGYQIIRYVHIMKHDEYPRTIGAGCVCAGRMEGDAQRAKQRERDFKNRQSRRQSFISHKRKRSKNGNEYFKTDGKIITVIGDKFRPGHFKAVYCGTYTKSCDTIEQALNEIFDVVNPL